MASLPLFYSSITVLDRHTHRDFKVAPPENAFGFAAGSHVIPALMAEFVLGCREMPILFIEEAGAFSPLFMVGMRSGRNDFVEASGRWASRHTPAYLRRYPFIGGEVSQEQHVICLDGGFTGLQENTGERLFTDEGEPSQVLEQAISFVAEYADAASATANFTRVLKELELFQTITIDIRTPSGASSNFHGFSAVSEERLNALPDEALLDLKRKGYLAPIYAHLISMTNFSALGERAGPREAA